MLNQPVSSTPTRSEITGRKQILIARKNQRGEFGRKQAYSDEYYTPPEIPAALGKFDLDPCAGPMTHARENFRLPKQDGLALPWRGRVWLNPPYSDLYPWLAKFTAHRNGIALLNARPDTGWFHRLASKVDALFFLRGRPIFLRPDGARGNPPCGSVLMAIGARNARALARCQLPGIFLRPGS